MKFDDSELETVARAVVRFNPYAKGKNISDIVNEMQSVAYQELYNGQVYCSTGGYVLTAFRPSWDNEIHIKASVAHHLFD